jgi:hypothetical protein
MIRADRTLKVDELLFLQLHVWPVIGGGKDLQTGRSCGECGRDISERPLNARFCELCVEERRRVANATWRLRAKLPRFCCDCGVDISDRHGRSIRCVDCAQAEERKHRRECWNRSNAKRRAA